ncbi:uncharacterized protein LOC115214991 isoform X1 [Octopus sinensis]|uniref:Uncharacterized protein LOC115214991 isoform X1 n=1 Tax=Octopus sinensis TaxID=2607531 RepID=A0A6P7SPF4_9MOLL|nr:uncharacterized protein LOC115214991 isoform X1 [Octopus sinensis]
MRGGAEYAGYLDIKLPAKSRTKRTKAWVHRWIVLHKISDLSAGKLLAKLDIYLNSDQACLPDTKLSTILLENVTGIVHTTKSRTHPHAFEIQNKDISILFFSATSPCETYLWVCLLREIFYFQPMDDGVNSYEVWVRENEYSVSLGLTGDYFMRITPSSLFLKKQSGDSDYEWPLSTLKRFYVKSLAPKDKTNNILIIESGLVTNIGEARLIFVSPRAEQILATIRTNIYIAMKQKDNDGSASPTVRSISDWETISNRELPFNQNSKPVSLRRGTSYDPSMFVTLRRNTHEEYQGSKIQDFSILANPPPKPARSWLYIPSSASSVVSETISCPDKVVMNCDINRESFNRQCIFRHSDSELQPHLNVNIPQQLIDDHINAIQAKTPTEMKGSICSRDSGIMCASELACQDSETTRDYRCQTFRSNSTDSAVSLQYERQKSQTQNKLSLNSPILERSLKLPSTADSVEVQSVSSNIYWDIDAANASQEIVPDLKEKKQFLSPKARSEWDLSCKKIKEEDENDNLSQKSNHEYEEVNYVRESWTEEEVQPPALPERPKTLQLNLDKLPQKSSGTLMEKIQDSLHQISPKIKRRINDKQLLRTKNLNSIINNFRKFSEGNKVNPETGTILREYKKEFKRRDSDIIVDIQREQTISEWRGNRILHSFSASDASQLFWNEEETKEGVFVVEQKIPEKETFLARDPFGMLPEKKIKQSEDIGKSRCYSECYDTDSNSASSDNDSDYELTFRRRTMSLESKLGHQIIRKKVKQLKNDNFLRKARPNIEKDTLLSSSDTYSSQYIDMSGNSLLKNVADIEVENRKS